MKVVIPMAGRGSRFADRGYTTPKPLIPVAGMPMVQRALQSLEGLAPSQIIFVVLQEHEDAYGATAMLKARGGPNTEVVVIPKVTEGQLCTVLAAREYLNTEEDVLIAASDTYVKSPLAQHVAQQPQGCAGLISTINLPGDRWSFARTNAEGQVVEVAEKVRISDNASTGLYYFSNARQLLQVADEMIANQEKTRGEYYVIPVYQKLINQGHYVGISPAQEMWDMGTPEAKAAFEQHIERTKEQTK